MSLCLAHLVRMWPPSQCVCGGKRLLSIAFLPSSYWYHACCIASALGQAQSFGAYPAQAARPQLKTCHMCVCPGALGRLNPDRAIVCVLGGGVEIADAELDRHHLPRTQENPGNPSLAFIPAGLTLPLQLLWASIV